MFVYLSKWSYHLYDFHFATEIFARNSKSKWKKMLRDQLNCICEQNQSEFGSNQAYKNLAKSESLFTQQLEPHSMPIHSWYSFQLKLFLIRYVFPFQVSVNPMKMAKNPFAMEKCSTIEFSIQCKKNYGWILHTSSASALPSPSCVIATTKEIVNHSHTQTHIRSLSLCLRPSHHRNKVSFVWRWIRKNEFQIHTHRTINR